MTTQPTPQPAGDAAIAQAFREMQEETAESGIMTPAQCKVAHWINTRAAALESARTIQAGKVVDDAMVKRAWAVYAKRTAELDESEQGSLLDRMHEGMRAALEVALAGSHREGVGRIKCYVAESKESCDAGPKYWVTIERDGETITPNWYFIKGRAEFDAAEWDHLLNGAPKPNPLDYETDAPATNPDSAAPDGDELVAAATRAREVLQQIVASPRHKGPLVSGASAASWALGQALSKPRVGEAVAGCWRAKWRGATDFGGWVDGLLSDEDVAKLKAHGLAEVQRAYTHSPAAIPDGMVVDVEPLVIHGYTVEDHEDWFSSPADAAESLREYSDAEAGSEFYITPWHQLPKQTLRITGPETEDYKVIAAAPGSAEGDSRG